MNRLQQLISKGTFATNVDKQEAIRMAASWSAEPPARSVPMSEYDLDELTARFVGLTLEWEAFQKGVRAAERHHGITGGDQS